MMYMQYVYCIYIMYISDKIFMFYYIISYYNLHNSTHPTFYLLPLFRADWLIFLFIFAH